MRQPSVDLSIVIPAYNEAARLPKTLKRIQQYLAAASVSYEIVVVLDGPTDDTREVLKTMRSDIKQLTILDRQVNRGKGYSVREGMLKASGRIRLYTDADNSTDISHLDAVQMRLDNGCDLVICSRDPRDAPGAKQAVPQSWYKRLLGNSGNLFIQLLAVRGIWDTQCGFKVFRDSVAEKIFSAALIDGWGFDIEILALARALKYKIGIVPARWINDPRSNVTAWGYAQVLWETVKIRYNLSAGRYRP